MKFTRIKGDDRPYNILRLPKLGHIRLGIKKIAKSGKEYPTETDYFVVPPNVQARYGEKPKMLPVMLPVEDEEMFLRQFYACYGANQKIKCVGNGEEAERRADDEGKPIPKTIVTCPHPENCDYAKKHKCRARTIVQVVLPDINMGGIYQLSTGSINSDIDIRSGIEMAKHLFGRISWVPMIIEREEKKIPDPETGNMMVHWPVKLYPQATMEQVNIIRHDNNRILEHSKKLALPEPTIEGELDDTPIEMVDDETQPETKHTDQPASPSKPLTHEEQIKNCKTLAELSSISGKMLKDPELRKEDKSTNERKKQLNLLMMKKREELLKDNKSKTENQKSLPEGCTKDPLKCGHSSWIEDKAVCTKNEDKPCQFAKEDNAPPVNEVFPPKEVTQKELY